MRVYIPKPNGDKRPLGIPAVEDKIVQMAIKKILESIFEQDFIDTSYGFRPNRSCHDALKMLDKTIMNGPFNYVVDMDISKFFDTVDHKKLMECLKQRVVDPSLLQLIGCFLKSGIMEEGKYFDTEMGIPQGGILSTVLANGLSAVLYGYYNINTSTEVDYRKDVSSAERSPLSKCSRFHHQDASSIGYFNPICPHEIAKSPLMYTSIMRSTNGLKMWSSNSYLVRHSLFDMRMTLSALSNFLVIA